MIYEGSEAGPRRGHRHHRRRGDRTGISLGERRHRWGRVGQGWATTWANGTHSNRAARRHDGTVIRAERRHHGSVVSPTMSAAHSEADTAVVDVL